MNDIRFLDPFTDFSRYKKVLAKYGGTFSFWENFKMQGIGSPRWIYLGGLEEFNIIRDKPNPELPWFNIELLKDGFIIRINKRQQLGVAIAKKVKLQKVELKIFDLYVPYLGYSVLAGELHLGIGNHRISLAVSNKVLDKTEVFFRKPYFENGIFETSKTEEIPRFLQENPNKEDYYTVK